ncbi:hypothetical protein BpHYR1_053463 [Brachionus plicatilis]|uniref:Uncharacterized protein n=1 Tax=Brachionus plicatilis TaxID=10195 RepID=A0A3M7QRP2_BRAPC|nr:hypothetical protein BpHYR1_053463 [Brachionus plicatilis]
MEKLPPSVLLVCYLTNTEYPNLNQACLPSKSHIYSETEEFFEYRTDCGVSAKSHYFGNLLNRRIINGNESDPDFFSWIVTLTSYLTKNCGGTLISF